MSDDDRCKISGMLEGSCIRTGICRNRCARDPDAYVPTAQAPKKPKSPPPSRLNRNPGLNKRGLKTPEPEINSTKIARMTRDESLRTLIERHREEFDELMRTTRIRLVRETGYVDRRLKNIREELLGGSDA